MTLAPTEAPREPKEYRLLVNGRGYGRFGPMPVISLDPTLAHFVEVRRLSVSEIWGQRDSGQNGTSNWQNGISNWTDEFKRGAVYRLFIDGKRGRLLSLNPKVRHRFSLVAVHA